MTKPTGNPRGRPPADPNRPCSGCGRRPQPGIVVFSSRRRRGRSGGRPTRDSLCNDCRVQANYERRQRRR